MSNDTGFLIIGPDTARRQPGGGRDGGDFLRPKTGHDTLQTGQSMHEMAWQDSMGGRLPNVILTFTRLFAVEPVLLVSGQVRGDAEHIFDD